MKLGAWSLAGAILSVLTPSTTLWVPLACLCVVAALGRMLGAVLHLCLASGPEIDAAREGFYR